MSFFFFFKQKTAYEIGVRLVGSEMCIRDRGRSDAMSMTVDRVVDATSGITRSQLLRYYESVADLMMPHLRGRPVAFLRAPEGIEGGTFFQKHLANLRLPGVAQFNSS